MIVLYTVDGLILALLGFSLLEWSIGKYVERVAKKAMKDAVLPRKINQK